MISVKIVNDINDANPVHWNSLVDKSSNQTPFACYEWSKSWFDSFATKSEELFIMMAYQDSILIGIAPFVYSKKSFFKALRLRFVGMPLYDYFDFIIEKDKEEIVIYAFLDYLHKNFGIIEICISGVFKDSKTFDILSQCHRLDDFCKLFFEHDVVPYLELPNTKEEFKKKVNRLLRYDISRREKRLHENGNFEFRKASCLKEAMELLEDFITLHIKKWERAGGYSAYKFESGRKFLRSLLVSWFEKGIANLYYIVYNNTQILSLCFGFIMNNRFIFYTHSYDPDYSKFSPGKILVSRLINLSIDNKLSEFDFGVGKEPYKLEWPCSTRDLFNIYLYKRSINPINNILILRGYLYSFYYLKILPFLRKIKPFVKLWRWINRIRGSYQQHG